MKNKLFTRDFTLVVLGQIISIFGAAILRFALNFYVLDITGRADIFALVLALSVVPGIIFSPVGGAIADRVNRRNLMVIFDFSSSAVVLVLFLLIGSGSAPVAVIGVVMAVLNTISSLYQPAVQASIPVLVPEGKLAAANGAVSGVNSLSALVAPILGSVLYDLAGLYTLVMISGIAFFLSAVMEIFIRIPFTKPARHMAMIPTIMSDMKTGVGYMVKKNPVILKVIMMAAVMNMLVSPLFIVGMPYLLRVTLNSSVFRYGVGMGILEFSMLLGAVLTGVLAGKMSLPTLYKPLFAVAGLIAVMAAAVTPLLSGLEDFPVFALLCGFGAGVMLLSTVISIFIITCIQKETPNELLGKVMAIVMAAAQCAAPLGQALYGILFERFSRTAYLPVLLAAGFSFAIAAAAKMIPLEAKRGSKVTINNQSS